MAVHGEACALSDSRLDHVRGEVEHVAELSSLQATEITQDVALRSPPFGPPNPDAASIEVWSTAVLHHRPQAIVARSATTNLEPNHAKGEVDLVVNDQHMVEWNFEELHGGPNGLAAQVHVGHRLEENYVLPGQVDFGELALELVPKARRIPALR